MKLIAALSLTLVLGSFSTVAIAQSQPPATPPPSAPPGPTEAAPTPEPAPVMGQEAPPPPTTQAEPQFTPPPNEPTAEAAPEPEAPAEEAPKKKRDAGPFSRGSISITLLVGTATSGLNDYMILGGGLGYYVVDGLEVGAEGTVWLFDSPTIGTVMPQVRYVLHMVPVIKPYVGTFIKHYMIGEDIDDFNSVGGKVGGLLVLAKGRAFLGLGAVYEHLLDCDDRFECDDWYPELSIALSL